MGIKQTVQIQNPDNDADFIIIALEDFDPAVHTRFTQAARPSALQDDPQPDYPDAALAAVGLDLTVSKLGPWLADQASVEMLTRLQVLETRRSALELIRSRINVLERQADE